MNKPNDNIQIVPVVLLIASNHTMTGTPTNNLNQALSKFQEALNTNEYLKNYVEFSLVTLTTDFNAPIKWVTGKDVSMPHIKAEGSYKLENGLAKALDLIDIKLENYFKKYHFDASPVLIMISDDFSFTDRTILTRISGMIKDDKLKVISLDLDGTEESFATCLPSPSEIYVLEDDNNYDYTDFFNAIEAYLMKATTANPNSAADNSSCIIADVWQKLSIKLSDIPCK